MPQQYKKSYVVLIFTNIDDEFKLALKIEYNTIFLEKKAKSIRNDYHR